MSVAFVAVTCSARWRSRRLQRSARIETCVGSTGAWPTRPSWFSRSMPSSPMHRGAPPQVVVSRGLVGALTSDELDAVVRHELTHPRNGHHQDLVLAGVVDATLGWPGLRASTAAPGSASSARPTRWRPISRERGCHSPRAFKTTETILGPVPGVRGGVQPVGPARGPGDASS